MVLLRGGIARHLLRKDYSKMTPTQKRLRDLRDRQSKERGRMAELALLDTLSDEQRSELDVIEKGTPDLERQMRAATIALEDEEKDAETRAATDPDAGQRERIELRNRASLTGYLRAALEGRQVDGAEAELRSAAGVSGIPLELWDVPESVEQRADAATGAPGTVGVNLDRIRPTVFANSIAPRLGIEMPRVASGTYASATITTSLTAGAKAKGADQDSTAAGFTVTSVTPKRISARLSIQIEDVAAVGQENFESILRENLSLVLSDELDKQAINGNGTAPNLTGILARLTDPTDPTDVATFDAFAAAHANGIDGLWSSGLKEVAIVCGPRHDGVERPNVPDRGQLQGRAVLRCLCDGEHWRMVDEQADAGRRERYSASDPVSQGPFDDGRRPARCAPLFVLTGTRCRLTTSTAIPRLVLGILRCMYCWAT